ncbi:hypothetical protein TNIN_15911 [Trichonephila inaurata madagascariensis]|uniref:PiggyBac transposable element-derived protein domain-containing protein n=1 Tax=Trichonephila inaurata madagascariensis TaxID=2747483 RepID=A0A8X6IR12_9ARAC|nr:hypothetical protein TNIN_15911 [Trichonephila inaurata madagascariensis]
MPRKNLSVQEALAIFEYSKLYQILPAVSNKGDTDDEDNGNQALVPSYRDYWSNSPDLLDEYISQQMSVKSFAYILLHLHVNDNSLQPKKGSDNFGKLCKIPKLNKI